MTTRFEPDFSDPSIERYLFSYKVTVTNTNDFTVQLKRRYWSIFDSNNSFRYVDGEGVVGETPLIEPGKSFIYESACDLETGIGYMTGEYLMINSATSEAFYVRIPKFKLETPWSMN